MIGMTPNLNWNPLPGYKEFCRWKRWCGAVLGASRYGEQAPIGHQMDRQKAISPVNFIKLVIP